MELVLEQDEIDNLLREALKARGVVVPDQNIIRIRRNNKTMTIRVAFVDALASVPAVSKAGEIVR
jgi:hypothetical protein